jgi:hypothetical protein
MFFLLSINVHFLYAEASLNELAALKKETFLHNISLQNSMSKYKKSSVFHLVCLQENDEVCDYSAGNGKECSTVNSKEIHCTETFSL